MAEPIEFQKIRLKDVESNSKISADADSSKFTASRTEVESPALQLDHRAERKLLRKLDIHVLPMISVLYMLAFVDRINIGNAKIQGLDQDLNMTGTDYNVALFVFFIPYILFEVPSNLLLKKVKPSTWLSLIMFVWGESVVFYNLPSTNLNQA